MPVINYNIKTVYIWHKGIAYSSSVHGLQRKKEYISWEKWNVNALIYPQLVNAEM